MAKSSGPKYYAVRVGRKPGVYNTWSECQEQTHRYRGARFKSFPSHSQAAAWVAEGNVEVASTAPAAISGGNVAPPASLGDTGNRSRFYAVAVGRTPGIFTIYGEARASHEGFRGAKHRAFDSREEAEEYMNLHDVDLFTVPSLSTEVGTRNEEVIGSDQESEISDNDSNDNSSIEALTATPPTPGSFMMSVYESTQREKNELYGLTSRVEGYDVAPSSAQSPPSSMRPPPSSYFAGIDNFEPDNTASFDDEFKRYISSQDIKPKPVEYRKLRTKAISHELKMHCSPQTTLLEDELPVSEESEAEFRLNTYQNMCRAIGLPVYETEDECTSALREPLVNIVDFIDAARENRPVKVWTDWEAFRKYTLKWDKRIDLEAAKEDGFVDKLLRWVSKKDGFNRIPKRKQTHDSGLDTVKRVRLD